MELSIFRDLDSLSGVTGKTYNNLTKLIGGKRIIDLLLHSPISVIDRLNTPKLNFAKPGEVITLLAKILNHFSPHNKKSPYKVICSTANGELTIVFFHLNKHYVQKILPIGSKKVISGKITNFATISHPDYIVNNLSDIKPIEPVYPLIYGISNKFLIKIISNALTLLPEFSEWIDGKILEKNKWASFNKSMFALHNPKDINSVLRSRERLACDEFLAHQLQLRKIRSFKQVGKSIIGDGRLRQKLISNLPFKLTACQEKVIAEISKDQAQAKKMVRLLQGDVGSGKTVTALFAMLSAVESHAQVAFMIPTEILATQHLNWIKSVVGDFVTVELLTGKMKIAEKRAIERKLLEGKIDILVGTHALFQDRLAFKDLVLVVIDEQHRFGVKQREKLLNKGNSADLLLISATPIPRTLNMALYGDIDCSILDEKPAKRFPIKTVIIHKKSIESILNRVGDALNNGAKIYWICPFIEESEKIDMAAVTYRFANLLNIFGDKVGLVHGKISVGEREETIMKFKNGEIGILVATTVVEVGIDIPDATVMIIENAERFGLSQLHQLRGRVGRGERQSFCILIYENVSRITYRRLKAVRDSNDGFHIAEQDLKIRGSGEITGYKQSGLPDFKFIDLKEGKIPLSYICNFAERIVSCEEKLKNHEQFNTLIKIFNQNNSSLI
ncbi:MAG: ATP-dependent DNA helicase RecG [Rickettsiaceae bacterium H1]|nr:ATP-dependent DNA helicase RecG [Rickettsiaceae bacterium H1]